MCASVSVRFCGYMRLCLSLCVCVYVSVCRIGTWEVCVSGGGGGVAGVCVLIAVHLCGCLCLYMCLCVESLACVQMLMRAIAHGGCTDTVKRTLGEKSLAAPGTRTRVSTAPGLSVSRSTF